MAKQNKSAELTAEETARCAKLFAEMQPRQGEVRTINKCNNCGHLFGRQFIPFGIGRGLSLGECMCQLTGNGGGGRQIMKCDP